ncbi:MAG: hypothetical protein DCC53_17145 [Chloroflexi bacterium]|nr:MAG: hypothetical protein DCC53_17145 [Chloroflexota bacterium]
MLSGKSHSGQRLDLLVSQRDEKRVIGAVADHAVLGRHLAAFEQRQGLGGAEFGLTPREDAIATIGACRSCGIVHS